MTTHTLALVIDGQRILLGRHQRGVGKGKLNGFGGKVEPGETVEASMIREVQEECGLTPREYKEMATLQFKLPVGGQIMNWILKVYVVSAWTGELRASEEMVSEWFDQSKIPFDLMWDDDYLWVPHVLHGHKLKAWFSFDAEGKVLDYEISKWEPDND